MLAILSAVVAGIIIYSEAGVVGALVCAAGGYATFVAYAWFRSGAIARDPVNMLALAARRRPPGRGLLLERNLAIVVIPFAVAFLIAVVLF